MKTLVIFNKETKDVMITYGSDEYVEVDSVLVDIPEGKHIMAIDNQKNVYFEDDPLSIEERIKLLEDSQADQDGAITELAEMLTE